MKTNIEKFNELGLREKKYAKTKVLLLQTLLELLKTKSLDEIKVQELCEAVEISQKTFFNYFLQKEHLLTYFIQLYSFEMAHVSSKIINSSNNPIEAIFEIFRSIAEELEINPNIMLEIIKFQSTNDLLEMHEITDAQKWYYFRDLEDVEDIEGYGLDYIIPKLLKDAQKQGLLEDTVDLGTLFISIVSLFYGSSILILKKYASSYAKHLISSIDIIFKGVGYARK